MAPLCSCGAEINNEECQCSFSSSDCITMDGSGNGYPITAEPYLDPDDNNLFTCEVDGMLVQLPGFIANPPRCSVTNNAVQSLANNDGQQLTFNTELYDTDTMHSTVTNTSRITIVTEGLYIITLCAAFAGNVTGDRQLLVRKNGKEFIGGSERRALSSASFDMSLTVSCVEFLRAGDYIQAIAKQDSGGALNILSNNAGPIFSATFRRRIPV